MRFAAIERGLQAIYGYGILNKARELCNSSYKIAAKSLYFLGGYPNLAANLPMNNTLHPLLANAEQLNLSSQVTTQMASSLFNFTEMQQTVQLISQHPATNFLKECIFVKQTCDFTIASTQWLSGNRSNRSMAHNVVNMALSCIPIILASTAFGSTLPAQVIGNAILLGCLAYSIRQDALSSIDPSNRESSPSIAWIKDHAIPAVRSFLNDYFYYI